MYITYTDTHAYIYICKYTCVSMYENIYMYVYICIYIHDAEGYSSPAGGEGGLPLSESLLRNMTGTPGERVGYTA